MMKMSVCPAVAEDAQAIAELNEMCFGMSFPAIDVARQIRSIVLSPDEQLLVAVYRGTMLGYIHMRVDRRTYRAPRVLVLCIAVHKDQRRKGIGRALYDAAYAFAKVNACEAVTASVGGSRAAQSFFASMGCEERLNRKQYIQFCDN